MTIDEKRKYVTGHCADMESCDSCPCLRIGTCYNKAILCLYDEKRLDVMINAFQTFKPTDKEVEQELAECEDNTEMSREDKIQRLRSLNVQMIGEPSDEQIDKALAFYSDGHDAECEDRENERADLVELVNDYCLMIPQEYCDTTKIAPCAMCMANPLEFDDWTNEDLQKFIDECRKLSADGFFKEKSNDYDTVSKPKHYASTSIECIDAMRETQGAEAVKSFCICNAFKYLWRHNEKNGDEDIRKASWYLNKAVELMGVKDEN